MYPVTLVGETALVSGPVATGNRATMATSTNPIPEPFPPVDPPPAPVPEPGPPQPRPEPPIPDPQPI